MARVYATEQEWLDFTGETEAPAKLDRLLVAASRVVDRVLVGRAYDVDDNDLPTDVGDVQNMREAVCIIASEASTQGLLDPGATHKWESVSIGSVSLSTLQGGSESDTPTVAGLPVPAEAQLALAEVGTRSVQVWG